MSSLATVPTPPTTLRITSRPDVAVQLSADETAERTVNDQLRLWLHEQSAGYIERLQPFVPLGSGMGLSSQNLTARLDWNGLPDELKSTLVQSLSHKLSVELTPFEEPGGPITLFVQLPGTADPVPFLEVTISLGVHFPKPASYMSSSINQDVAFVMARAINQWAASHSAQLPTTDGHILLPVAVVVPVSSWSAVFWDGDTEFHLSRSAKVLSNPKTPLLYEKAGTAIPSDYIPGMAAQWDLPEAIIPVVIECGVGLPKGTIQERTSKMADALYAELYPNLLDRGFRSGVFKALRQQLDNLASGAALEAQEELSVERSAALGIQVVTSQEIIERHKKKKAGVVNPQHGKDLAEIIGLIMDDSALDVLVRQELSAALRPTLGALQSANYPRAREMLDRALARMDLQFPNECRHRMEVLSSALA